MNVNYEKEMYKSKRSFYLWQIVFHNIALDEMKYQLTCIYSYFRKNSWKLTGHQPLHQAKIPKNTQY